MRTGLLATAFLNLLGIGGYAIWELVQNASYNPGPPERDAYEYLIAVGGFAYVALLSLWLAYRLGRRIRARANAYFAKPS